MFEKIILNVRNKKPIIHNITNYVTVNDCANILLACGASPIMADDIEEVEDITKICNGLNINIGTLNSRTIQSMIIAGKKANEIKNIVVLDPVGAGASELRTKTALNLIKEIKFDIIRGNISEIKTLALGTASTKGVDADVCDVVTKKNLNETINFVNKFAEKMNCIIAITGAIDIVSNGEKAYCIYNGNKMMSDITGTGCQLSALIAAFAAANNEQKFEATAAAVCVMGIAGQIAHKRLNEIDGNATYRNYIIDAVYNINSENIKEFANYEII